MPQRVFISDCEGPISKNDNAFELAVHFIPNGARFFGLLSRYDDVLADIVRRPGYSAGYTLKLIAPFLKAYGATNESITLYCRNNMLLVRDARISLERIRSIIPAYIVSTSYSQYIEALCTVLGIPKEHTFSTCLNLDAQSLSTEETRRLQALQEEILSLPSIEIPEDAERLEDLSSSSQRTIARLDTIFWEEFPKTTAGRILLEVRPVGGVEKARVVADITMTLVTSLDAVFYVGDSITDAEILRIVKDSGGVAVSFNGNRYAVEKAEISVLSDSLLAVAILAEIFAERGRDGVLELVKKETPDSFMNLMQIAQSSSTSLPEVSVITPTNLGQIARKSIAFRREVRGEAIAALG